MQLALPFETIMSSISSINEAWHFIVLGAASVIDLFGATFRARSRRVAQEPVSEHRSIESAIAADIQAVGGDLWRMSGQMEVAMAKRTSFRPPQAPPVP